MCEISDRSAALQRQEVGGRDGWQVFLVKCEGRAL